jgi:hypothetical protein
VRCAGAGFAPRARQPDDSSFHLAARDAFFDSAQGLRLAMTVYDLVAKGCLGKLEKMFHNSCGAIFLFTVLCHCFILVLNNRRFCKVVESSPIRSSETDIVPMLLRDIVPMLLRDNVCPGALPAVRPGALPGVCVCEREMTVV